MILIYGGAFFYMLHWLDNRKRLNINHMVNAREFNGEVMMNIVLRLFPQKINHQRYRQILHEKYEHQIIRLNNLDPYASTTD